LSSVGVASAGEVPEKPSNWERCHRSLTFAARIGAANVRERFSVLFRPCRSGLSPANSTKERGLWGGQSCPQPPFRRLLRDERNPSHAKTPAESRLQPGLAAPPFVRNGHQNRGLACYFEPVGGACRQRQKAEKTTGIRLRSLYLQSCASYCRVGGTAGSAGAPA